MTKLTTEVLKEIIGSYPENSDEIECVMAIQLLAYDQAAKNPVAWRVSSFAGLPTVTFYEDVKDSMIANGQTPEPLYAAPVLPKQPELLSIGELLQRLEEQTGEKWVEESVQHVIPGQLTLRMAEEKALSLGAVLYDEEAEVFADGWNACRAEMLKAQQNEPQNIPENIPAIQLDPHVYRELVNVLRDVALEYHAAQQLRERISRALSKAVTTAHPHLAQPAVINNDDDDLIQRLSGRAKFLRDKGEIKTPQLIEAAISALSAQPVSEPYKLNGWISVDNELPEEGARVLVFSDGAFVLLAEFTGGEFYDVVRDGEEFFETVTRCVTHWMPLPAAPAQESE